MTSQNPVAIVTGGGRGIGRACTLALVRAGYAVSIAGRHLEALQETMALAPESGDQMVAVSADVSDPQEVTELFRKTIETFGRLDLLFNNAGIGAPPVPLDELPLEQWQQVVATNLTGAFLCTQEAFRIMKKQRPQGGRIINNGSISAHVPRPNSAPYTATKHALTGLTRATSLDGRAFNIACGQIDIGNAATDLTRAMERGVPQANGTRAPEPTFDVTHVADAVLAMARLPLDANIQFMTITATQMPYIGRG